VNTHWSEKIKLAVEILKKAGATEIYLFGSLARGEETDTSDIDLMVRGIHTSSFFQVYGDLLIGLRSNIDLIDMDSQPEFSEKIKSYEKLIRVA